MNRRLLTHFLIALILFSLVTGCVTTGEDVVNITTLKGSDSAGLKPQERAQLEEIKRSRTDTGVDPGLSAVIEKTPHFTVGEYLSRHPGGGGGPGQDYRVGGYDILSIIVYEEADLSREAVRVSADGFISFPLVGRVKVENMTTSEIENLIAKKLADQQYLLDAHVSVMVTDYKSKHYMVLGAVRVPGSHPLQAQERVLDALSKAEGAVTGKEGYYTEKASNKAMIVRTENPGTAKERKIVINLELQKLLQGKDQVANILLMDRDVLFVAPAEHFYIMGQVKTPGSYQIPDKEITLVEAISMAGGFTPIAARNRTRIIRVEDGVEKIIQVKVDAITKEGMKIKDVAIQPNDVIIIPESFF